MSASVGSASGVPARWLPDALAVGLALLISAPVLAPGYVLSYDAVATPRQWLVPDALGLGSAPPRAVPADAVVALLTQVVDGAFVQKALLVALLVLAGAGAWRLLPGESQAARCAVVVAYMWNPYVAERLVIGHWWLLLAYGLLPWVVRLAWAASGPDAGWPEFARLWLAVAAGSLVATGGVLLAVTVTVLVAFDAAAGRRSRVGWLAVLGAWTAQLPWLLPGVLRQGTWMPADPLGGVEAFAVRAETLAGTALTLLGLGGIWNGEVIPASRLLATATVGSAFAVAGVAYGWRPAQLALGRRRLTALAALALLGLLGAWATASDPGREALAALIDAFPGAGLLRDAHKWVAWWALLLAVLVGFAAERLRAHAARWGAGAAAVALALIAPLVVLPDLAWGVAGRLQPVGYPDDYYEVRDRVSAGGGDVLSLPWSSFRAFDWNGGRTSLDPLPRWLPLPVVVDDTLVVDGSPLPGESARATAVGAVLASGARATESLPSLGFRWVVVALDSAGPRVPAGFLDGAEQAFRGRSLALYDLGPASAAPRWPPGTAAVVITDLALLLAAGGLIVALLARKAEGLLPFRSTGHRGRT